MDYNKIPLLEYAQLTIKSNSVYYKIGLDINVLKIYLILKQI
jgi:hypothetical protein